LTDTAPLIFETRLNMLAPVNPAAREAVQSFKGRCVVKITGAARNQRRRGLFWIVTGLVANILNDMHDLTLTDQDLYDIVRRKLRMYDEIVLPSGEVHQKLWSTSDRAMTEPDRAEFTNKAFHVYELWTGIPVEDLRREGEA
jgi:hypothetical protein